jgi:hypothetical protein
MEKGGTHKEERQKEQHIDRVDVKGEKRGLIDTCGRVMGSISSVDAVRMICLAI